MFNWLKKLFGLDVPDTPVIAQETKTEAPKATVGKVEEVVSDIPKAAKPKSKPKAKKATKKAEASDLSSMNKTQLLAEAKKLGIKANASLKKDELIERIKAG
jgi:hypothetical protein